MSTTSVKDILNQVTGNPYGKFCGTEAEYVLQALDRDSPENRKIDWLARLEEKFCQVIGSKYAISVTSGTAALHAAQYAAGVGEGDEVIGPALTVIMDAGTTIMCGGTPVFADVNPDTFTMDPKSLEEKITPKTKAIIVVSICGLSPDMDPIMAIAKKHNLIVIEDSAQTMLGKYKGKYSGTIGHMGIFSFEDRKHISACGEGGMIVTDDEKLADSLGASDGKVLCQSPNLSVSGKNVSFRSCPFADDVKTVNIGYRYYGPSFRVFKLDRAAWPAAGQIKSFELAVNGAAYQNYSIQEDILEIHDDLPAGSVITLKIIFR